MYIEEDESLRAHPCAQCADCAQIGNPAPLLDLRALDPVRGRVRKTVRAHPAHAFTSETKQRIRNFIVKQ